jgi:hypothetical protein
MKSSKSTSKNNNDQFYASIKLVSGEEILSYVIVDEVNGNIKFLLDSPIVLKDIINLKDGTSIGYQFEPWMKIPEDDMFIIDMEKIITVSEITNKKLIELYINFVANGYRGKHNKLTKEMGYISSVNEARSILEKLYNN